MANDLGKMLMLLLAGGGGYAGRKRAIGRENEADAYQRWRRQQDIDAAAKAKSDEEAAAAFTRGIGGAPEMPIFGDAIMPGLGKYGPGSPYPGLPVTPAKPPMTREELTAKAAALPPGVLREAGPNINTYLSGMKTPEAPVKPSLPASPTQIALARQALQRMGLDPSLIPDNATVDDIGQLNDLLTTFRGTMPEPPPIPPTPEPSYGAMTTGLPAPSYNEATAPTGPTAPSSAAIPPSVSRGLPTPAITPRAGANMPLPGKVTPPDLYRRRFYQGEEPEMQAQIDAFLSAQAPAAADSAIPPTAIPPLAGNAPSGVAAPPPQYQNRLDYIAAEVEAAKQLPPDKAISAFNALQRIAEMYPEAPIHPVPIIDSKTRKADFLRDASGNILTLPKAVADRYAEDYSMLLGKDVPNAPTPRDQVAVKAWSLSPFAGAVIKGEGTARPWYEGTVTVAKGDDLPTGLNPMTTVPRPYVNSQGVTVYKTPDEIIAQDKLAATGEMVTITGPGGEKVRIKAETWYTQMQQNKRDVTGTGSGSDTVPVKGPDGKWVKISATTWYQMTQGGKDAKPPTVKLPKEVNDYLLALDQLTRSGSTFENWNLRVKLAPQPGFLGIGEKFGETILNVRKDLVDPTTEATRNGTAAAQLARNILNEALRLVRRGDMAYSVMDGWILSEYNRRRSSIPVK